MQKNLKFRDHAEVQTKTKRAIGNIRNLLKKKTTISSLITPPVSHQLLLSTFKRSYY